MQPLVLLKSNSYVEQAAILSMREVIQTLPVDAFFSVDGTENTSFSVDLTLIAGWPEEPNKIPSIIVTALTRKVERAGLMAQPYHNNYQDNSQSTDVEQYLQFFIGTGTYTLVLQAHSYDLLYKLQAFTNYVLSTKLFMDLMFNYGIALTSNYLTWTNPTQRTYSTLVYHTMACNIDFRVESITGYTEDGVSQINEFVLQSMKE